MRISLVVAYDTSQYAIGYNGSLFYTMKEDMKHFRKITTTTNCESRKNMVVMGRKTWESLPNTSKPLPNRINVVLSASSEKMVPTAAVGGDIPIFLQNLEQFMDFIAREEIQSQIENIFIIGGSSVYQLFLEAKLVDQIIATEYTYMHPDSVPLPSDTYFPYSYIENYFIKTEERPLSADAQFQANIVLSSLRTDEKSVEERI
jgi:dihydrofolate reductase